jgi:hypothetical protein
MGQAQKKSAFISCGSAARKERSRSAAGDDRARFDLNMA